MKKYMKELVFLVLIALPYIYLASIYGDLPEQVPTHFNMQGEPDDWSNKSLLLALPALLCVGTYLLMLLIPRFDPKKKIERMGDKYYSFRFIMALFMSLLSVYLLSMSNEGGDHSPNMMMALIGALFAVLGNYFQAIRPNYFIGIRTPWTLENEEVWKRTHRLGGWLWMAGGLLIVLLSFLIQTPQTLSIVCYVILGIIVLIPVVHSYLEFQKEKKLS